MIVICEECGKKYRIDPERIRGEKARVKCRECNHVITVSKNEAQTLESHLVSPGHQPNASVRKEEEFTAKTAEKEATPFKSPQRKLKLKSLGLRTKMMILFLFIPSILIASAGVLYLWQLNTLSALITNESTRMVTRMAEDMIAETSRGVASQCKMFFENHPELNKEDLQRQTEFKQVAVQKVGMTGYTALYEMPDSSGVWRTWAHVNPKIIAIDMSLLKKPLGNNFDGFWKVYTGVRGGKESRGYYSWQDKDGSVREKYMVCTPVQGTPYVIAATTYLDEFTKPVKMLESQTNKQTLRTRNVIFGILVGTLLLIGFTVSIYGHSLTKKIRALTEVADRISIGELDAEIDNSSGDELGALGEAIGRMQDSIRLSIERLRRRR